MKKMTIAAGMLALLTLSACGDDAPPEPEVQIPAGSDTNVTDEDPEQVEEAIEEEASEEELGESEGENVDPYAFFMEDGTTATYEGKGIEYAALSIRTEYLEEDHIALYEDNGGTILLRVYRLSEDKVELVKEEPEFYEEYTATAEELSALEPISTYLEFPIEEGNKMNGRTIVETGATVETPYDTFEDAIVIENKSESSVSRSYITEGFGEVKREFLSEEGEEEFVVTSSLETIE
ncbi:hypothetical protein [Planococcus salinus]|uniref:Uncharacterized protein n=1 Tax=Planococcus salinus TaxID=1848460 RepID=A0A3M8P571_9BACL|nr:hypothetical protein [Planococcus salinus]RNF38364.1 hypothetical protein EEX84_14695 [Planococcus salinus]